MKKTHWWQKPVLRRDEDEEKEHKTSWLELFFDLVFVATIAELSHILSHGLTGLSLLKYLFLFIPIWWYWIGSTFYNDRFATNDVSHRIFTLFQILAVAGLALHIRHGLSHQSRGFALSYIFARVVLIIMWIRGGIHNPTTRPLTNRYATGFSISVVLWVASLFVPLYARLIFWGGGLLFDLLTPLTTLFIQKKLPKLSTSHLPERFGLFTIIVLGESVVGVIIMVAGKHHLSLTTAVQVGLGIIMAFCIWWMYFDFIVSKKTIPKIGLIALRGYLHLPLVIGITAIGASVINFISFDGHDLPYYSRLLICGALSLSLFSLGGIECTVIDEELGPKGRQGKKTSIYLFRFGSGILILGLGFWGYFINPILLLAIIVCFLVLQVIQDIYIRHKIREN
jgi:low temperature requirement protein LtrA